LYLCFQIANGINILFTLWCSKLTVIYTYSQNFRFGWLILFFIWNVLLFLHKFMIFSNFHKKFKKFMIFKRHVISFVKNISKNFSFNYSGKMKFTIWKTSKFYYIFLGFILTRLIKHEVQFSPLRVNNWICYVWVNSKCLSHNLTRLSRLMDLFKSYFNVNAKDSIEIPSLSCLRHFKKRC